jgi:hypothetical protein
VGGRYWIAVLLAGCADLAGIGDPTLQQPDAPLAPCKIGGLDLCLFARPESSFVVDDDFLIDTERDCQLVVYTPPARSVCVVYAKTMSVNKTLRAVGSRPLVLAATETLDINGTVDVSSYRTMPTRGASAGAAADDESCKSPSGGQYGGRAGGSFAAKGGNGGTGFGGTTTENAPGVAADPVPLPEQMRGGCPGTYRGRTSGTGGGAVWLAAGRAIQLGSTAKILANGAGGASSFGGIEGYGVGGGSGGLIRIAAPDVVLAGIVAANGGGGGEGVSSSDPSMSGADGLASSLRAPGGTGGSANGGDGGNGGAGVDKAGSPGQDATGSMTATGGGGGGSVGYIHIIAETYSSTGVISPAPTM